jgi:DNA-binding LacI/PurR family transcriptional regulator
MSALASADLTLESPGISVLEVACTRAGGVRGFEQVWASAEKPTAIVAFSDIVALGVLDAARDAGVSVPGELSVTGFDDLAEAQWSRPALTTVRQPIESKGRLAAEFLVESIAGSTSRPHKQRLHTTLLVRDSTAPPATPS